MDPPDCDWGRQHTALPGNQTLGTSSWAARASWQVCRAKGNKEWAPFAVPSPCTWGKGGLKLLLLCSPQLGDSSSSLWAAVTPTPLSVCLGGQRVATAQCTSATPQSAPGCIQAPCASSTPAREALPEREIHREPAPSLSDTAGPDCDWELDPEQPTVQTRIALVAKEVNWQLVQYKG